MKQLVRIEVRMTRRWESDEGTCYDFEIRLLWKRFPRSRYNMTQQHEVLRGEVIGLIDEVSA